MQAQSLSSFLLELCQVAPTRNELSSLAYLWQKCFHLELLPTPTFELKNQILHCNEINDALHELLGEKLVRQEHEQLELSESGKKFVLEGNRSYFRRFQRLQLLWQEPPYPSTKDCPRYACAHFQWQQKLAAEPAPLRDFLSVTLAQPHREPSSYAHGPNQDT